MLSTPKAQTVRRMSAEYGSSFIRRRMGQAGSDLGFGHLRDLMID